MPNYIDQLESLKPRPTLFNPNKDEPFKARLGRCYELAGNLALHNWHVTLVHGSIQGCGKPRIGHAWAELPDGSVWEPASNKIWNQYTFKVIFNPEVACKFDALSVATHCVRHEYWGPWSAEAG